MRQAWRFVQTGSGTPAFNMALDEALFAVHDTGATPPTLRVYSWQGPTLSLGYAQNVAHEVDLEACATHGVAVVRRPTGGRAVLHDQEVTYSVVMPLVLADGLQTLTEHYRRIGLALADALHQLGVPVQLARPQVRTTGARAATPACFAALSRYEVSVAGRKLVGSAQKRGRAALLQHGSMPFQIDRARLFQCLRVPAAQRASLIQEAYATMTGLDEVAPRPVTPAALHEALRHSFAATFDAELCETPLQPEEWRLTQQLQVTKYATTSWNHGGPTAWRQGVSATA